MHIEHETSDRHCRIAAIINELVPVLIAQLARVHAEGMEQILRMARRKSAFVERLLQSPCFLACARVADETVFKPIEQLELFLSAQRSMIGDVICRPDKVIECQDDVTVARMNE